MGVRRIFSMGGQFYGRSQNFLWGAHVFPQEKNLTFLVLQISPGQQKNGVLTKNCENNA